MVRKGIVGALLAGILLATAFNGCGEDDSDASTATKKQFVQQADAICKKAEAARRHAVAKYAEDQGKELFEFSKPELEEMIIKVALPPMEVMSQELASLEKPSGEEEKATAVIGDFEHAVDKAEEDPLSVLLPAQGPFGVAAKSAGAFGLQACAQI